jgi:hypothetical protein
MKEEQKSRDVSKTEKSKRSSVAWNFFWIGFLVYTIAYSYPGITISLKYLQPFQILGILLFVPSGIYLIKWSFESNYLKIVFLFYLLWSVVIIFRGFTVEYEFLKSLLFTAPFSIFIYFAPLILIFRDTEANLKKLVYVIIVLNLAFVVYVILFNKIIISGISGFYRLPSWVTETFTHFLSLPAAFILLTYLYHKKSSIFFSLFILVITFVIVTIRARRGLMLMSLSFMIASYLVYYFTNKGNVLKVIISIGLLAFVIFYSYVTYSRHQYGTFGLITNRIDEDTRKGVVDYFYDDMSTRDLILGRGINGQYYCPGIDETKGSVTVMRSVIETGYLQIVLKGGFISLVIYLLITVPALFIGLFNSKNVLTKASAIWILLYTIFLYPTYVNMFSLTYLIIWISVGICYSKTIRGKSNEEIGLLFQ